MAKTCSSAMKKLPSKVSPLKDSSMKAKSHPTYYKMVLKAVTFLSEDSRARKGFSKQLIANHVKKAYCLNSDNNQVNKCCKLAIIRMIEEEKLIQVQGTGDGNGYFKLHPKFKTEMKSEEKKKTDKIQVKNKENFENSVSKKKEVASASKSKSEVEKIIKKPSAKKEASKKVVPRTEITKKIVPKKVSTNASKTLVPRGMIKENKGADTNKPKGKAQPKRAVKN